MSFDPERTYHELERAGLYWADADAAASMYEESKKSVLADLMNETNGGTNVERERHALASRVFKEHVEKMVAARKEANRAKVRYDALRVLAEMRRTEESTRRAEASLR